MMLGTQAIVITPEQLQEIGRYWESGTPRDWDPPLPPLMDRLDWLTGKIVAPHFDRPWSSHRWFDRELLKNVPTLIGIDEYTALVAFDMDGKWEVRGRGFVTLHRTRQDFERYSAGDKLVL